MRKIMKLPFYIPFIGILLSAALFVFAANTPNVALLITGLVLFHISGWILATRFLLCGVGFFSSILGGK